MKSHKSKSKYTIGSLLLLLAFLFYVGCNPDRKQDRQKPKQDKVESHSVTDSLTVFEGKVTGIKDGDTFEVLRDGKPERVRLVDIDSPESQQAFGKAAKKYASDLCFGKTVRVEPKKKRDRYGRILGTIYVDDTLDVNAAMIKAGYAWRYKYSRNKDYGAYEKEARKSRFGLWADENPINPWQWRKEQKQRHTNY
ncbi:MAG: nuclease [Flavobacterium psychrophilum]|nr:MAG: nuclease [Flavobacterium psychrophilum]